MTVGRFVQVTPFLHVPDIDAAVAFFRDVLGFTVGLEGGGYAYVEREGCGVRMLQNVGEDGAPRGNRRFGCYFDVDDVDALYAELKPRLDGLPPGDVHGPADKPYGQRELLVLGPDGNVIAFGCPVGRREAGA